MASSNSKVVILGTGGTIAGTAANPADNLGYRAAQLGAQRRAERIGHGTPGKTLMAGKGKRHASGPPLGGGG